MHLEPCVFFFFYEPYFYLDALFRASSRLVLSIYLPAPSFNFFFLLSSPDSRKDLLLLLHLSSSPRLYYLPAQAGTFTLMYEVNRKARCVHTSRDRGLSEYSSDFLVHQAGRKKAATCRNDVYPDLMHSLSRARGRKVCGPPCAADRTVAPGAL